VEVLRLSLKSFRNFRSLAFEPGLGINLLLGSNAQGKTNLLEALYYLSTFSSPRTPSDSELVYWGESSFYVQGQFRRKETPLLLEAGFDTAVNRKEIRLNRQPTRPAAAVGAVNAVLFTPDDLHLVKGHPQVRRQFLDREIIQVHPMYGPYLARYNRVLRQRNHLLRDALACQGGRGENSLRVWDQQLAETAAVLLSKRQEYLKKLALLTRLQHRKLTDGREDLQLSYASTLAGLHPEASLESIRDSFLKALDRGAAEERRRGLTLIGPHRDDMEVRINGRPARVFGSQGQQRTAVLALKLAQVELICGEKGTYPLLLLDDVFSELDAERQKSLLGAIKGRIQTFLTGTREALAEEKALQEGHFYLVREGRLQSWKR
jgi:DNA replication and repair protein RecF